MRDGRTRSATRSRRRSWCAMSATQSDRTSSVGRAIDGVLWVAMLSHVAVAIHEAAHVLVALLCGGCVPLVRVGEGRLLFSTTFKGSTIEVRDMPMSGFAAHTIENNRPYAYVATNRIVRVVDAADFSVDADSLAVDRIRYRGNCYWWGWRFCERIEEGLTDTKTAFAGSACEA